MEVQYDTDRKYYNLKFLNNATTNKEYSNTEFIGELLHCLNDKYVDKFVKQLSGKKLPDGMIKFASHRIAYMNNVEHLKGGTLTIGQKENTVCISSACNSEICQLERDADDDNKFRIKLGNYIAGSSYLSFNIEGAILNKSYIHMEIYESYYSIVETPVEDGSIYSYEMIEDQVVGEIYTNMDSTITVPDSDKETSLDKLFEILLEESERIASLSNRDFYIFQFSALYEIASILREKNKYIRRVVFHGGTNRGTYMSKLRLFSTDVYEITRGMSIAYESRNSTLHVFWNGDQKLLYMLHTPPLTMPTNVTYSLIRNREHRVLYTDYHTYSAIPHDKICDVIKNSMILSERTYRLAGKDLIWDLAIDDIIIDTDLNNIDVLRATDFPCMSY